MKALRWHAKKDLRYEEVTEPSPGQGQVKVKVDLAGICGTDLKEYTDGPSMIFLDKVPLILGHEFVGKIVELGIGVTNFKIGDRVTALGYWYCGECYFCQRAMYNICINPGFTGLTTNGCMAEYVVVPSYAVYSLPDSVPNEVAVLVEPLAVGFHAVLQGNVHVGDRVCIIGDGTIGLCTFLAARAAGASEIYVISKHKERGKIAKTLGATEVIYFNDGNTLKSIRNLTEGLGADVSFECVGHTDTPQLALDLTRNGGTVVIMGVFNKPCSINLQNVMFTQKTIIGSPIYVDEAKAVISLLAEKRIDAYGLITSKVPLKDAVEKGFEKLITNKDKNIKILIDV